MAKYCAITNIFFLTMKFLKIFIKIVKFFIKNPKICLNRCFANTYVPPKPPKEVYFFLGHLVPIYQFWVSVILEKIYSYRISVFVSSASISIGISNNHQLCICIGVNPLGHIGIHIGFGMIHISVSVLVNVQGFPYRFWHGGDRSPP